MREIVKEVLDTERELQSTPFITGSHNFKIDMGKFFHNIANCVNDNKQFSIIYKMMKDINSGNMVVIYNPQMMKTLNTTKATYYGFLKRLEKTELVTKIEYDGRRGEIKYMINPRIIYNHRKCKSNRQYQDNCSQWDYIYSVRNTNDI